MQIYKRLLSLPLSLYIDQIVIKYNQLIHTLQDMRIQKIS
jgi:hypothetical protein